VLGVVVDDQAVVAEPVDQRLEGGDRVVGVAPAPVGWLPVQGDVDAGEAAGESRGEGEVAGVGA
jgi:hypothetical protein